MPASGLVSGRHTARPSLYKLTRFLRFAHKTLSSATIEADPRPTPAHRCAILFHEHRTKPRFVWIETKNYGGYDSDSDSYDESAEDPDVPFTKRNEPNHQPGFDKLLGDDKPLLGITTLVLGKLGGGEHFNKSIVAHKDFFVLDDPNRCARRPLLMVALTAYGAVHSFFRHDQGTAVTLLRRP